MKLKETFWREYRSLFGEPPDVFDTLGYREMKIELKKGETKENILIRGGGYVCNFNERFDFAKIEIILNLLEQYNIKAEIVRTCL